MPIERAAEPKHGAGLPVGEARTFSPAACFESDTKRCLAQKGKSVAKLRITLLQTRPARLAGVELSLCTVGQ